MLVMKTVSKGYVQPRFSMLNKPFPITTPDGARVQASRTRLLLWRWVMLSLVVLLRLVT
jgi:hypothetical protein